MQGMAANLGTLDATALERCTGCISVIIPTLLKNKMWLLGAAKDNISHRHHIESHLVVRHVP